MKNRSHLQDSEFKLFVTVKIIFPKFPTSFASSASGFAAKWLLSLWMPLSSFAEKEEHRRTDGRRKEMETKQRRNESGAKEKFAASGPKGSTLRSLLLLCSPFPQSFEEVSKRNAKGYKNRDIQQVERFGCSKCEDGQGKYAEQNDREQECANQHHEWLGRSEERLHESSKQGKPCLEGSQSQPVREGSPSNGSLGANASQSNVIYSVGSVCSKQTCLKLSESPPKLLMRCPQFQGQVNTGGCPIVIGQK